MSKSICNMLVHYLGVEDNSSDMYYLLAETLLYLMKASRVMKDGEKAKACAFVYQDIIRPRCARISGKRFRLKLHTDRSISLGLKLLVIKMAKKRGVDMHFVQEEAVKLDIPRLDAARIFYLFEECDWFRREAKRAAALIPADCAYLDYAAVSTFYRSIEPEVMRKVKSLTYHKLRFLAKSNNEQLEDYHSRLLLKVVHALYAVMPTDKSPAHLLNYLKQAVHNHAMNLIKQGTSQKSGRLRDEGLDANNQRRAPSLLMVSYNQMRLMVDNEGNEITPDAPDTHNTIDKFEVEFCINEILDRYKHTQKRYRFITILLGAEDLEFSSWLRNRGLIRTSEDNSDLQARCPANEFNRYTAEFLNVSYAKVERFLQSIQKMLATDTPAMFDKPETANV